MAAKNLRCDVHGCPSVVVPRSTVAPIVALACLIALFLPFLISVGLRPNSHISWGTADNVYTPTAFLIVLVWIVSVILGWTGKHENTLYCFIDSFGLPGFISAGFYAAKANDFL
jgi:hypothetical protein